MAEIRSAAQIPPELQRAAPRPVGLTAAGVFVAVLAFGCLAGAPILGIGLFQEAGRSAAWRERFDREAVTGEAEVTALRRTEDNARRVFYRYSAAGRVFTGRQTLQRGRWRGLEVGSRVPVRYLLSAPGTSYLRGGPRVVPGWLAPAVAVPLSLAAALIGWSIRRQWRLLSDGRPAPASVTGSSRQGRSGHRVRYEFRTFSGAVASGSYLEAKSPPPPGTELIVLYAQDNAGQSARYPLGLVRAK
jgi:hypothetical protein